MYVSAAIIPLLFFGSLPSATKNNFGPFAGMLLWRLWYHQGDKR